MRRHRAYRVRIDPTEDQKIILSKTFGCCRLIYNLALEQRREFWRKGRIISYTTWAAEIRAPKAAFPFFSDAPYHCLQQALRDLEEAYARFFSGDAGYPRPRRKFENDRCRFPDPKQIVVSRGQIKLPKLGVVKAVIHRPVQGRVKSVTIAREGEAFYASVLVSFKVKAPEPRPMREAAYDVGVSQSAVEDDGTVHQAPTMSLGEQKRKIRLQQALARKPSKASRRRKRVVDHLRRLEVRMARRHRAYCHRTSHRLTAKATHLAAEDLKIRNMTASAKGTVEAPGRNVRQKAGLNRGILNTAPGTLRRMVEYKASWRGTLSVCVDARHTSQNCSECGQHPKDDLSMSDLAHGRVTRDRFECPLCGFTADADVNAARNIRARGRCHWAASLNSAAGYPVAARGGLCAQQAGEPRTRDPGSSRPKRPEIRTSVLQGREYHFPPIRRL